MAKSTDLLLHEEVMLLALHDDKGTIVGDYYAYAVGGAILAELLLGGRIRINESRKKKMVELANFQPYGDEIVDECLHRIADAKRRGSAQTWVQRFANTKGLKHRLAEQLCRKDILRADEDKVLLIFTRKIYPELNPKPERALIARLQKAIFTDAKAVDPRTVVLVSLADKAGLLKAAFNRKELRARKKRIQQISNGDLAGAATKEAIEAMQAAVAIAVIMPAITAAAVSS